MSEFAEIDSPTAEWVQPAAFDRRFELRAHGSLIGELSFRSSFGTLALAETRIGRWSFKRVGFLNPRVTVRVEGTESDLAVYEPKVWGDGVLSSDFGTSSRPK